ncbi:hypothetical protein C8R45DRAFT_1041571 [Mycena sanguinolenta]|nr:hypothetical protein C8R45DRAFT_1041571 [Mycena sanguinolenta]
MCLWALCVIRLVSHVRSGPRRFSFCQTRPSSEPPRFFALAVRASTIHAQSGVCCRSKPEGLPIRGTGQVKGGGVGQTVDYDKIMPFRVSLSILGCGTTTRRPLSCRQHYRRPKELDCDKPFPVQAPSLAAYHHPPSSLPSSRPPPVPGALVPVPLPDSCPPSSCSHPSLVSRQPSFASSSTSTRHRTASPSGSAAR